MDGMQCVGICKRRNSLISISTCQRMHEGYSNLEYEEIAELRKTFLKLHETEGIAGIKRFARNHRKRYRANPKQVYKYNSSIYGNLSAGTEFEKLMHHAHIQVCGMTQTQPEPSMFVKIKVDDNDIVIAISL